MSRLVRRRSRIDDQSPLSSEARGARPVAARLSRADWRFVALCVVLAAMSIVVVVRTFDAAFPEIAIDFRVTRETSRPLAETFLRELGVDVSTQKHAVRFDSDDTARIFLERSVGLEATSRLLGGDVRIWSWRHRWFTPLVEEEVSVDVAPGGEIIGYARRIPESVAIPEPQRSGEEIAAALLARLGVQNVRLVDTSERRLPKRVQRIYVYESARVRPAGAPYRHTVTLDGDRITGYTQGLDVPDAWLRSYRELRSRNATAGQIDTVLMGATMIAAIVVFIVRLRRGDLPLRFLLGIGGATVLLVGGMAINNLPSQFAWYDTTTSYPAFLGQLGLMTIVQSIGMAMLLIVVCGAGEVLYRERLPSQLAMPRIWTRRSLTSKRVFRAMLLGYALVPAFMAYQAIFYLVARRFGAWSPAELRYDDALNTALPWVGVLFAGFFPAFSEEFLSRAFSIPFFQRFLRSRWLAIVIAAFLWGFGHSTYPNQPFWIRGVEVGIAGIVAGLLMDRVGLLPLLIWHYTIDAVYTATLLLTSGNTYYVVSAALASLIFALPLVASIALYVRNRGFVPDDDLTNAAMPPPSAPPLEAAPEERVPMPPAPLVTRGRVIGCIVALVVAILAIAFRPASPRDAIDYRITAEQAKAAARAHIRGTYEHVVAAPIPGFRSWDRDSSREDGGSVGGPDRIAATHLLREGTSVETLTRIFDERVEPALWTVRFFTPQQKEEAWVEVHPETGRVVGYHKYQDEARRGAALAQPQALAIARGAFATYGVDANAFEVREALSYQQPNRRDWLFHFEERQPLANDAFRRISVRVAGDEVTQFQKHVRIPESVYREATTQTLLNVILFALQVIGAVILLALVITGIIVASRAHGLPWRNALRWTAALAILPVIAIASGYEQSFFSYSTSIAWDTFRVRQLTSFLTDFGLRIGALFLALAGLEAAMPYALRLGTREGRARFGRGAVVAALTAISIVVIASTADELLMRAFPASAEVSLAVPQEAAIPLPAVAEASRAIIGALLLAAAVALYATAVRGRMQWITIAGIFCVMLDGSVTLEEMPLMLARAAAAALLAWVVARHVLDSNPLAWPLTFFLLLLFGAAATLIRNERPDLVTNGVALLALAAVVVAWIAGPRESKAWNRSTPA